jgi:SPP1 gp7 family putative phage head morphogenesis protein
VASKLTAPTERAITLPGVRANAGIQADYRKRLNALIERMHRDITREIAAQYKRRPPMAMDDSPAMALRTLVTKLADKWVSRFEEDATKLAGWFARQTLGYSDRAFARHLQVQGFSVPFTMTREMNDAYQAVIGEQVGLIKSIPERYLGQVQTFVMQSVQRGRDLSELSTQLQKQFGVTKRRAALIARDQNNRATSVMTSARQQALGITTGVWKHSHAGRVPRPSHVAANGKTFEIAKGMLIDGEYILPGQKINCRCYWAPQIKGFEP